MFPDTNNNNNITIRSADRNDIPSIHSIYNHYVLNTVNTFLQTPPPLSAMISKFHMLKERGLPYLVATRRKAKATAQEKESESKEQVDEEQEPDDGDDEDDDEKEEIMGYTYLSPFRGNMLSYAPTVELSLFVRHDLTSSGAGSRLLAAILEMVDSATSSATTTTTTSSSTTTAPAAAAATGVHHAAREHAEYEEYAVVLTRTSDPAGETGRVRNVIACMALDTEGREGGEGLRRWYEARGFVERGRLKNVGYKMGRWIDTVYLQYMTPDRRAISPAHYNP